MNPLGGNWLSAEQGGSFGGRDGLAVDFRDRYAAGGTVATEETNHRPLQSIAPTSHCNSLRSNFAPYSLSPPPSHAGPSSKPFQSTSSAAAASPLPTETFNPIVHTALAHRSKFDLTTTILPRPRRRGISSQTTTHADSSEDEKVEKPDKRRGGKVVVHHDATCQRCGIRIAKLIFRGTKSAVEGGVRGELCLQGLSSTRA